MSYTVIITEEIAANVAVTTQNYPITIEYNATNIASGSTYGNANVEGLLSSGVLSANIITSGDGEFGNVTSSGFVFASGNVVGTNVIGNGQYLTNVPGANVSGTVANATYATTAGSATTATTANIALVANSVAGANVTGAVAQATQAATANVALVAYSVAAANVSGTVANATYATSAGSATTATTAGTANIALVANSVAGANVTGVVAQATTAGTANVALVANSVSGANVSGAVAQATQADTANVASVAYSVSAANVTGTVANAAYATASGTASTVTNAAQANITSVGTLTSLSVSGNITGGNVISAGNLQSTQQTVIGTANVGTTGNIVISGKNIATDMAWSPDGGNAATAATGRIMVGTGWNGNITHSATQNRLVVSDSFNRSNTASSVRVLGSEAFVNLTANVTNGSTRNQALGGYLRIGGGAAANTQVLAMSAGSPFGAAAGQFNLDVGNISPYNLGNTTVSHAVLNGGSLSVQAGSTITNAYGIFNIISTPIGGTAGNVGNVIGYTTAMPLGSVPAGNVYGFYHGSNATGSITGASISNSFRQAPQYYAFYNADDHAQVQLGSLKNYNEFRYDTATSGTVNISKTNGQVQYIRPSGNITIGDFQNFVTETTDGSTYDQQIDTVTFMIAQGATPYTVSMPTGNASIKYAGNTSTVANTASSVTMVSVSAANIAGTKTYMVTISPEFV